MTQTKHFVLRFKFTVYSALKAICQLKKISPRTKIHGKSMVILLKEAVSYPFCIF